MTVPDKRDALGEIPARFDSVIANALAGEEKKVRRKASRAVLVAALLIVILAATALAVGIRRSEEADAVFQARQALGEKYELTTETLGLFGYLTEQSGSDWTVRYIPIGPNEEKMGEYTVTISPGQGAQATWTHDDVDPALWADGSLDAPVWGQAQMIAHLRDHQVAQEALYDVDWSQPSFERMAERGGVLFLVDARDNLERYEYLLPDESDLDVKQARQVGREALAQTYGIEESVLDAFVEVPFFVKPQAGGERQYVFEYQLQPELTAWHTEYVVQVASPSGEVLRCRWMTPNEERTLPEGPLDAYHDAVKEFMQTGALSVQSAHTKAEIVQRVTEAGFAALIEPDLPYAMPGAQDIPEEDAVTLAVEALGKAYALQEDTLVFFARLTTLLDNGTAREWVIEYVPIQLDYQRLTPHLAPLRDKLGTYKVTLDAASGEISETTWSLEKEWDDGDYTEHTWATAPVYHGKLLPWMLALENTVREMESRYPEEVTYYDLTLEDLAAYDQYFRDAGFPVEEFHNSLPGPKDLTAEEALTIATDALFVEMQVTLEDVLATGGYLQDFSIRDPEQPSWGFSFQFINDGVFVDYGISIDARTGEVLYSGSITGGVG